MSMTHKKFLGALDQLGLTPASFARLTGLSLGAVIRWGLAGDSGRAIPSWVPALLNILGMLQPDKRAMVVLAAAAERPPGRPPAPAPKRRKASAGKRAKKKGAD